MAAAVDQQTKEILKEVQNIRLSKTKSASAMDDGDDNGAVYFDASDFKIDFNRNPSNELLKELRTLVNGAFTAAGE